MLGVLPRKISIKSHKQFLRNDKLGIILETKSLKNHLCNTEKISENRKNKNRPHKKWAMYTIHGKGNTNGLQIYEEMVTSLLRKIQRKLLYTGTISHL